MLGSAFDFNNDGSLDFGEGMAIAGVAGTFANEVLSDMDREERREGNAFHVNLPEDA